MKINASLVVPKPALADLTKLSRLGFPVISPEKSNHSHCDTLDIINQSNKKQECTYIIILRYRLDSLSLAEVGALYLGITSLRSRGSREILPPNIPLQRVLMP